MQHPEWTALRHPPTTKQSQSVALMRKFRPVESKELENDLKVGIYKKRNR
jgi:hypothetical protein